MVIDAPLFVFFATDATEDRRWASDRWSKNSYGGSNAAVVSNRGKPNICFTVGVREEAVSKSRRSFRFSHLFDIQLALGCGLQQVCRLTKKMRMRNVVS